MIMIAGSDCILLCRLRLRSTLTGTFVRRRLVIPNQFDHQEKKRFRVVPEDQKVHSTARNPNKIRSLLQYYIPGGGYDSCALALELLGLHRHYFSSGDLQVYLEVSL